MLTDDTTIEARAVVIATGARYRSLPLDRWAEFEGAGIYFAALLQKFGRPVEPEQKKAA